MVRHNNQLPDNLPQLQNLIKRDPDSYKDEFLQQLRHFKGILEVFSFSPDKFDKHLDALIMFLAQVAQCYPEDMKTFPQDLIDILREKNDVLDNEMRMTFCRALILLRNKNMVEPTPLLSLFFELLRSRDKALRAYLKTHIVTDIKNINAKHKNAKVNSALQNFMFDMLDDKKDSRAAKMSVDVMIELYHKKIWNDAKTVNVIALGCFSNHLKVKVTTLRFFIGKDEEESDSDSDSEPDVKEVMMANKVNKKSKKREKKLATIKKKSAKAQKKKNRAPSYSFSALHLIHDPQAMAEKLFKKLEKKNDKFEIKLITLDVISRLIGLHNLFVLNFYPYIQRFLLPRQREVTKLLQFIAQASHELVPPEYMTPVLKTIANNFIVERNSSDVMAIGLNAVREIVSRCPLAIDEDLLCDLTQYKRHRERSVMMAARSLIGLFRNTAPEMLAKKDRGRPTEENYALELPKYGDTSAKDFVPGAEVVLEEPAEAENSDDDWTDCSDDEDDSDGEWVDVNHSSDEEGVDMSQEDVEEGSDDEEMGSEVDSEDSDDDDEDGKEKVSKKKAVKADDEDKGSEGDSEDPDDDDEDGKEKKEGEKASKKKVAKASVLSTKKIPKDRKKLERKKRRAEEKRKALEKARALRKIEYTAERKAKAAEASSMRLFTDEDFKRMDATRARQRVTPKRGQVAGGKRPREEDDAGCELVRLGDIENIYKKRKNDKAARLASVREGQEDRETHGYQDRRQNPHCSKTNRENSKKKNFQMLKHKVHRKVKKSFREKQIAFRNHLTKLKRMN
ncbi:unnamed protein product [Trichogramma brassicae]|uniref:Protein SDA1 n=1 Tax=Trichogramma brassicae TaxID=86971 RepID=A0A6H5I8M9_9HYME|nr:unnamed protein product [Trichogramma brassicae]